LAKYAKELGLATSTFTRRLTMWTYEEAFTKPHRPTGHKRDGSED